MSEQRNLILTILLSTVILVGWQFFYDRPSAVTHAPQNTSPLVSQQDLPQEVLQTLEQGLKHSPRIKISTPRLEGSLSLTGARFDDLSLTDYFTATDKKERVRLFAPSQTKEAYFAEFGWLSSQGITAPNNHTVWQADKSVLTPQAPVTLSWQNPQGIDFRIHISVDQDYLFHITQEVVNPLDEPIHLLPYGLVNKAWTQEHQAFAILHEGPIGVFNKVLVEAHYNDLKEDGKKQFRDQTPAWLGITDKYWLSALIPDKSLSYETNFTYKEKDSQHRFQSDFLGASLQINPHSTHTISHRLFVGAKQLSLLEKYKQTYDIPLFDRAVDFGLLYFLTKPLFKLLALLHAFVGNFGFAILLMTVLVKGLMYPLANKSYRSLNKMKLLQPQLLKLREKYKEDKMQLNHAVMELYQKEKVNPLSGCLPILIQIPVFFALYKVLFVTIEMRHAPFFGWIKDLSAPDPTSIFNGFGLIPWSPPSMLMIGAWPVLMAITMYLQQRMNPEPSDPVQAKVMKLLPVIFVVMFHSFPVGLIIYWAWNNLLSVIQQWVITRTAK